MAAGPGSQIAEVQIRFSEWCDDRAPTLQFFVTRDPDDAAFQYDDEERAVSMAWQSVSSKIFSRRRRCLTGKVFVASGFMTADDFVSAIDGLTFDENGRTWTLEVDDSALQDHVVGIARDLVNGRQ